MSHTHILYEFEDHFKMVSVKNNLTSRLQNIRVEKTESNLKLIADAVDNGVYTVEPASEYQEVWQQKRAKAINKGGYGAPGQQLELLYDTIKATSTSDIDILNAIRTWVAHVDSVKTNNPK